MKKVAVLMGSDSDWPVVRSACAQLDAFGIPYEAHIMSASNSAAAPAPSIFWSNFFRRLPAKSREPSLFPEPFCETIPSRGRNFSGNCQFCQLRSGPETDTIGMTYSAGGPDSFPESS